MLHFCLGVFFFFFKPFFITRTPQKTKTEPNQKTKPKQIKTKQNKTEQRTQVTGYLTSFCQGSLPQSPGGRVVNNTVQRRAHEPSAMQSQLQGTGGWGILVFKKGGFTTKGLVLPAADAEGGLNMRDLGAEAPRCSCILESMSGVSGLFFFFLYILKRLFFLLLLLSFFSPLV